MLKKKVHSCWWVLLSGASSSRPTSVHIQTKSLAVFTNSSNRIGRLVDGKPGLIWDLAEKEYVPLSRYQHPTKGPLRLARMTLSIDCRQLCCLSACGSI